MLRNTAVRSLELTFESLHKHFETCFDETLDFIKGYLFAQEDVNNLEEYVAKMKNIVKTSTCQEHWIVDTVAAHCLDCQKSNASCICMKCFLAGNHLNHRASMGVTKSGNCDCGDCMLWKKEGFCPNHHGCEENPELTQLTSEQRETLIIIFKACLSHFIYWTKFDPFKGSRIIRFLRHLIEIGDAFRRCCAIAFNETFSMIKLMKACRSVDYTITNDIISFLGCFSNDDLFKTYFSREIFANFPKIVDIRLQYGLVYTNNNKSLNQFDRILFHAFSESLLQIITPEFDWASILCESFELIWDYLQANFKYSYWKRSHAEKLIYNYSDSYAHIRRIPIFKDRLIDFEKRTYQFIADKIECCYFEHNRLEEKENSFDQMYQVAHFFGIYFFKHIHRLMKDSCIPVEQIIDIFLEQLKRNFGWKTGFVESSILDPATLFTNMLSLHLVLIEKLWLQKYDIKKEIAESIKDKMRLDEFCLKFSILPLRYLAACSLQLSNMLPRLSYDFIVMLDNSFFKLNGKNFMMPLFIIIQTMLGIHSDKNAFVHFIMTTFGLFDDFEDQTDKDATSLHFIHFLCCLIYDRHCLKQEYLELNRLIIKTHLKINPMTPDHVMSISWSYRNRNRKYIEDTLSYSTRVQTPNGSVLKLNDTMNWHPIIPCLKLKFILQALGSNPDTLMPFPEFIEAPFDLELLPVLTTPSLFTYEYTRLVQVIDAKASNNIAKYICNILISTSQHHSYEKQENPSRIFAVTFEELMEKLKDFTFSDFLQCKIKYIKHEEASIIDMLLKLGPLGITTLTRMNIGFTPPEIEPKVVSAMKERVNKIKELIMETYKQKLDEFDIDPAMGDESDECCICKTHNDDVISYPVICYSTVLPSYIDSKLMTTPFIGMSKVIGLHACSHMIHSSCDQRQEPRRTFFCPIDRGLRSDLMPKLHIGEVPTPKQQEAIQNFVTNTFDNNMSAAIKCLAGELVLLEIRHRSRPDVIDKISSAILLKNLYWNIKYAVLPLPQMFAEPTEKLIFATLQMQAFDLDKYKELIKKQNNVLSPQQLYAFLRRAALLQHFAFDDLIENKTGFIDWDTILSFSELCERYEVISKNEDIEIPMFKLTLPPNFLDFARPPYNADFSQCTHIVYDMLLDKFMQFEDYQEHIIDNFEESVTMCMFLVGSKASRCFITSIEYTQSIPIKCVYVDEYGDEDIGFEKGSILHLNNDILENNIDYLLSGEWTNRLTFNL